MNNYEHLKGLIIQAFFVFYRLECTFYSFLYSKIRCYVCFHEQSKNNEIILRLCLQKKTERHLWWCLQLLWLV